jgi:hypothetical protein
MTTGVKKDAILIICNRYDLIPRQILCFVQKKLIDFAESVFMFADKEIPTEGEFWAMLGSSIGR